MALKRLTIDGYGQLEINNCAFRRDGRIEAQCALGSDFSNKVLENGMIVAVDQVNRTVGLPASTGSELYALNYSAEHMYDERKGGLKDFGVNADAYGKFLPRLGYLAVGDKFTSNCVAYDDSEFATETALLSALDSIKTTALYGGACTEGAITISTTAQTYGPKLKVVEKTTMPNGKLGIKFQVIAD